jgi:hypothetical protein
LREHAAHEVSVPWLTRKIRTIFPEKNSSIHPSNRRRDNGMETPYIKGIFDEKRSKRHEGWEITIVAFCDE